MASAALSAHSFGQGKPAAFWDCQAPGQAGETASAMPLSVQVEQFDALLQRDEPLLALAPMQGVTDLPFWKVIRSRGSADVYYTEYFRVHADSRLEKPILRSITENPTGQPVVAQMIGNSIPNLVRTARELQEHPIAAVDLNLGCPAPIVFKKCAGGGLLREPERVDRILGALREAVETRFTVKTRLGFDDPTVFNQLLPIFAKHNLDLLTVHGRTVKEMYRSAVHYDLIARAVGEAGCPVLANGNVYSAAKAESVLAETSARGLMIGRGIIRNPWLFTQIRQQLHHETPTWPSGLEVLHYVTDLFEMTTPENYVERSQVQKMKKYMNYFGIGIDPKGRFLHDIRRAQTKAEFFDICREHLDHDQPMLLEPHSPELKSRDVVAGIHT
jgi:tRNA-dihydrouridine synthase